MENLGSPLISAGGGVARKKRTTFPQRPNHNPKPLSNYISCSSSRSLLDTYEDGVKDLFVKSDGLGNESKVKKVKLKVGGVTHTMQTKSMAEVAQSSGASAESFTEMGAESVGKGQSYNYLAVRNSKRIPKKRTMDEEFTDEEGPSLDNVLGGKRNKKEHLNSLAGSGNELAITTRKRALENVTGTSHESGPRLILLNGLPPAPSKRQKEMLPEVDQQLRKAEAAQRRRLQAEKAAKEAEAEAIRKILGQDSTRKKREEKMKRQLEELAQEKTAVAAALGPNTVRWVMGPSGTVITFSDDLGLPVIFSCLSSRYPPPREKCVGPNCNKEYKYRDSKSKLPSCSLHCYKAIQG